MKMRMMAVVVGLALAAVPALAYATKARKPAAAHAAAHRVKAPKPATKEKTKAPTKAKAKKLDHAGGLAAVTSAIAGTYAVMPEAERRAIQADLALVGVYDGAGGGDFDDRTVAAVRAFQQRNNERETGILTAPERDLLAAAAKSRAAGVGWRLIEDTATGARLGVPEKLVPQSSITRIGSRWSSAQGQIRIESFRLAEASLPALFEEEKRTAKRHVVFSVFKPDFFVMSGEQGLKDFFFRAEMRGSELRGVSVLYDQATAGVMGPVAAAIANTFVGFPDPNAPPPQGLRQTVEYGTAIAVDDRGDLIASAEVTDGCQAITVPGFGHAERVAADKTGELALLRLYGARNLVAAVLAGDGDPVGDLTLVGIADPISQAGGDALTKTVARISAQNIDPAPQLGFSGAAVIDAKGRLLGMVELKPAVVAGASSVGRQATLVPVAMVRSFLQAHGVPGAATGHAPAGPSVLRIVCVRK